MIEPAFARTMARYNQWQNASLYAAADGLPDAERQANRGAFFGSIQATLNHLLWADRIWMSRLAGMPRPAAASIAESTAECADWSELMQQRADFDRRIVEWADRLTAKELADDLSWFSAAVQREVVRPRGLLVVHFFNHQTHHRGQVHCLLTAVGARPEDTDLFLMPGEYGPPTLP